MSEHRSNDYVAYPKYNHSDAEENCQKLAKRVNKQFNGSNYMLITEPECFVETYKQRITEAVDPTDPEFCSLASSCNYDLKEIDRPKIDSDGKLIFYVHRNSKEFPIPCRITCSNPSSPYIGTITSECLPFVK